MQPLAKCGGHAATAQRSLLYMCSTEMHIYIYICIFISNWLIMKGNRYKGWLYCAPLLKASGTLGSRDSLCRFSHPILDASLSCLFAGFWLAGPGSGGVQAFDVSIWRNVSPGTAAFLSRSQRRRRVTAFRRRWDSGRLIRGGSRQAVDFVAMTVNRRAWSYTVFVSLKPILIYLFSLRLQRVQQTA